MTVPDADSDTFLFFRRVFTVRGLTFDRTVCSVIKIFCTGRFHSRRFVSSDFEVNGMMEV